MLFRKAPPPVEVTQPTLEWENVDRIDQRLWVSVEDWQYKVFPSRQAQSFGSWLFQFEGRCGAGPLNGLVGVGAVEALERDYNPGMLEDRWKKVPDCVEGHASLIEHDDLRFAPSFGITLYCQDSALDWIYRAFAAGAFGRNGGVGLELDLSCPNNTGGPFWRDQWRKECLLVTSWKVFAGNQPRPQ